MKYINIYTKPDNTLVTGINQYPTPQEAFEKQNIPYPGCRYYGTAEIRSPEIQKEYDALKKNK